MPDITFKFPCCDGINQTSAKLVLSLHELAKVIQGKQPGVWPYVENIIERQKSKMDGARIIPIVSKDYKDPLGNVIFGGLYEGGRKAKHLVGSPSGFVGMDFDKLDLCSNILERLHGDEYAILVYTTPSRKGIRVVCAVEGINSQDDYADAYHQLADYYLANFGIQADLQCSNMNRVNYISYDPEANLRLAYNTFIIDDDRRESKRMAAEADKRAAARARPSSENQEMPDDELKARLDAISSYDHITWKSVVYALKNEGYDASWAHYYSAPSEKYDAGEIERIWASNSKSKSPSSMGSIVYHSEQHGYQRPVKPKKNNRIG